jgi:hypothetical protein
LLDYTHLYSTSSVDVLQLSHGFAHLIGEGCSQSSFYGDDCDWTRDSRIDVKDGYFWRLNRICVSRETLSYDLNLPQSCMTVCSSSHIGVACTIAQALDNLCCRGIHQDIKGFYEHCVVCQRARSQPRVAHDALDPLHVPPRPRHTVYHD